MPFLMQVKPLWDRSTLTLAELAAQCNISESSASRYLNGKVSPPADIAEKILEVLGADVLAPSAPESKPQASAPQALQIWEVYKEEIEILQTTHANHISTLQASHATHIAAVRENYLSQISDLKRDKTLMLIAMLALLGLVVYFAIK
jgi:transcriptional regulator with XRE-family HTH domain